MTRPYIIISQREFELNKGITGAFDALVEARFSVPHADALDAKRYDWLRHCATHLMADIFSDESFLMGVEPGLTFAERNAAACAALDTAIDRAIKSAEIAKAAPAAKDHP